MNAAMNWALPVALAGSLPPAAAMALLVLASNANPNGVVAGLSRDKLRRPVGNRSTWSNAVFLLERRGLIALDHRSQGGGRQRRYTLLIDGPVDFKGAHHEY